MKKLSAIISFLFIFSCSAFSQTFDVGDKVMVYDANEQLWFEATILEKGVGESKVHWEGYSSDDDSWIKNYKLWKEGQAFLVGDKLQGLETDGKWYNAKVLKLDSQNNRYFIH